MFFVSVHQRGSTRFPNMDGLPDFSGDRVWITVYFGNISQVYVVVHVPYMFGHSRHVYFSFLGGLMEPTVDKCNPFSLMSLQGIEYTIHDFLSA